MRGLRRIYFGVILFILLFLAFCLSGCISDKKKLVKTEVPPAREITLLSNHSVWSRCGILHIKRPLFNITGFLNTAARPNSSIHLFVAPDTSFESALYVVEHCPSLFSETINPKNQFRFDYLPAGNYVAMLPRGAFYYSQGFPIINEFNRSNYSVKFNFHGGDYRYSLVSFSIFPISRGP